MQADVYTAFLTDKVKVFATQKGVKPFKIAGKYIRKAYPFLLSSAMILSGCAQSNKTKTDPNFLNKESISQNIDNIITSQNDILHDQAQDFNMPDIDWKQVYDKVIEEYRLNSLKDKVPFSQQEILNLIASPYPPELTDKNFNHCAENQQNFWEIVRNGIHELKLIDKSDILTENQKKEYKITAFKMLSQMSKYKGSENEVDLTDYNNQKTFLFFEKVIQHKTDYYEVLGFGNLPGFNDERTEFLGRYYKDFENLANAVEDYPYVEKFINALYSNTNRFILTPQDSAQANAISKEMYQEWAKEQHIEDQTLYNLTDTISNFMEYDYLRGSTFLVKIAIQKDGLDEDGKMTTIWLTARHELQHLGQLKAASNEEPEDNHISDTAAKEIKDTYTETRLGELGPTLSTIAWEDHIYKKIHNIDFDAIVDYGVTIDIGKKKIPLGIIGPTIWKAEQENPSLSIDAIIGQPKILKIINDWGNENVKLTEHELQHNHPPMVIQYQR